MKTQTKALVGTAAIAVVALIFAYPVFAASLTPAGAASAKSPVNAPPTSIAPTGKPAPSITAPMPASAGLGVSLNGQLGGQPPNSRGTNPNAVNTNQPAPKLSVGQTVTLTSTSGTWTVISPSGKPSVSSGTASGTVTLAVTGAFRAGYALSIGSGSLVINGTTYTIASGSAELGPYQAHLVGQGTFTSAEPGSFLVSGTAHASFFNSFDTLRFDVQANGVEYGVILQVSASTA